MKPFFKFKIGRKLNAFYSLFLQKIFAMSFKFKLSVNVFRVCKIDRVLNLTGIILERIRVLILLAVENDRSAVEVVAGLTSKTLHM